jgi:peroxiredoxin
LKRFRLIFTLVLLGLLIPAAAAQSGAAATNPAITQVPPVAIGDIFPAATFANLNESAGPVRIDLASSIGKRPVLLFYWIAGNPRADTLFAEVQTLVKELGTDKIQLFGVVLQQPGRGRVEINQRLAALEINVPVLDDEGFKLGQQLRIQSVPNITLLDKEGRLRLTNGASLIQTVEYNMDLADAIRRVSKNGDLGTYGFMDPYFPVKEMIGKPCPDFRASLVDDDVERSLTSLMDDDKLNVLIFWSVDCPHCRKAIPEIHAWVNDHPEGVNVVAVAEAPSEPARTKTKEFCELNKLTFKTMLDGNAGASTLYQVTTIPTVLLVGPDGVIADVMIKNTKSIIRSIDQMRQEFIKPANPS